MNMRDFTRAALALVVLKFATPAFADETPQPEETQSPAPVMERLTMDRTAEQNGAVKFSIATSDETPVGSLSVNCQESRTDLIAAPYTDEDGVTISSGLTTDKEGAWGMMSVQATLSNGIRITQSQRDAVPVEDSIPAGPFCVQDNSIIEKAVAETMARRFKDISKRPLVFQFKDQDGFDKFLWVNAAGQVAGNLRLKCAEGQILGPVVDSDKVTVTSPLGLQPETFCKAGRPNMEAIMGLPLNQIIINGKKMNI